MLPIVICSIACLYITQLVYMILEKRILIEHAMHHNHNYKKPIITMPQLKYIHRGFYSVQSIMSMMLVVSLANINPKILLKYLDDFTTGWYIIMYQLQLCTSITTILLYMVLFKDISIKSSNMKKRIQIIVLVQSLAIVILSIHIYPLYTH